MRSLPARSIFAATFALTVGLAGCASGGGSTGEEGVARGSSTRIAQAELEPLLHLNVYDAIRRLRPGWLRGRAGQAPNVVIDGSRQMEGLDILRSYNAADIRGLEFMSASDATNRYGMGFQGGAIVVSTRR